MSRRGRRPGRISPMPSTAQISSLALTARRALPRRAPRRPSAADSAGPCMIVGATTQRRPSASTAAADGGVGLVDDERGGQRRVEAGHADHGRLVAELARASGRRGPSGRRRPTIGDTAHASRSGHDSGVAHPGDGEHRTDRHDRVGGRDHDRARLAIASSTPGAGRRPSAPSKRTPRHGHRVSAARSTPGSRPRRVPPGASAGLHAVTMVRTGSSVTRAAAGARAPPRGDLGGDLRERAPSARRWVR